jgi:large subunit ribosomal protein L13
MKEINAENRTIGRVATEAAMALMGKDKPNYKSNAITGSEVTITNAAKMKITAQRIKNKSYKSYSGYPGGQKIISMSNMITKKGYAEILRRAIKGMIPRNKLQNERMKKLTITE